MSEILLKIKERVEIALETGESHFREFKSAFEGKYGKKVKRPVKEIAKNISKTLVAFANADGGELFIGIEDNSTVTGVPHTENDIEKIFNASSTHIHKSTPLREVKKFKIDWEGKTIVYFQTPKSSETIHLTSEGLCVQRRDRESVPIAPNDITFERNEQISRQFDREFAHNASVNDLDLKLVEEISESILHGLSPEKCLQHLGLAEYSENGLVLRRAALFLFGSDISVWHPRCQVRFVKVNGTELLSGSEYNAQDIGLERGNVLNLIQSTWEKLRPFLVQTKLSSGAVFETKIMYPELACQEAIINAIAHRDYSIQGSGIEIYIYDDRLEVKSPGVLLSTITIEKIEKQKGVHESRNALISRVLRERGYMRELGEGMRRIYDLLKKNELRPPELISDNNSFSIILHHKSVYSSKQKLWLEEFESDNLSSEEKAIVLLGANENVFSAQDIWDVVGIVDTEHYRKLVHSLQNRGALASKYGSAAKAKQTAKNKRTPFKKFKRFIIIKPNLRGQARKKVGKDRKPQPEQKYQENKIYIANLPWSISESDLYEMVDVFGDVSDIFIPYDSYTKKPRGYAFVEYENGEQVAAAINGLNGTTVNGRKIAVSKAYKKNNK